MNELVTIETKVDPKFLFSARDVLTRAGIDKKNIARTIRRNILDNEMIEIGVDYIKNTTYSGLPSEDTQHIR